jgi:hypothetical protein
MSCLSIRSSGCSKGKLYMTRSRRFIGLCGVPTVYVLLAISGHFRSRPICVATGRRAPENPIAQQPHRPEFRYSVIPGGAYSPAELRAAIERDSLVRAHFANFDLNRVHIVILRQDQHDYVSFRLKNHIFWTKRRIRIAAGEVMLTDDRNYARTRCGNRLSKTPVRDTTPLEPAESAFSEIDEAHTLPVLPIAPSIPTILLSSPSAPQVTISRLLPSTPLLPPTTNSVEFTEDRWCRNCETAALFPQGYLTARPGSAGPPNRDYSSASSSTRIDAQVPEPSTAVYSCGVIPCFLIWVLTRVAYRRRARKKNTPPDERQAFSDIPCSNGRKTEG